jgi:hypothetical protein
MVSSAQAEEQRTRYFVCTTLLDKVFYISNIFPLDNPTSDKRYERMRAYQKWLTEWLKAIGAHNHSVNFPACFSQASQEQALKVRGDTMDDARKNEGWKVEEVAWPED